MAFQFMVSPYEFFLSYGEAMDFICPEIVSHHHDVAYLSIELMKKSCSPLETMEPVILAALIHDLGIFSYRERLTSKGFEFENEDRHAAMGAAILKEYTGMSDLAGIVRHHHRRWEESPDAPEAVPPGSHIIYLADRIAVLIDKSKPILPQRRQIVDHIKTERGRKFGPDLVDAFLELAAVESFWLKLSSLAKHQIISESLNFKPKSCSADEIMAFGKIFINAIDLRCRWTAAHSMTVASVAEKLAALAGYDRDARDLIKLAGYFHDLGKVAVPSEIINKPGKLTEEEWEIVKSHPFYTYTILKGIRGLGNIPEIAFCHHETLDGNGYPFHFQGYQLLEESKLLAVADILTALTEKRPYRDPLSQPEIIEAIRTMAAAKQITTGLIPMIESNAEDLIALSQSYQEEAFKRFDSLDSVLNGLGDK